MAHIFSSRWSGIPTFDAEAANQVAVHSAPADSSSATGAIGRDCSAAVDPDSDASDPVRPGCVDWAACSCYPQHRPEQCHDAGNCLRATPHCPAVVLWWVRCSGWYCCCCSPPTRCDNNRTLAQHWRLLHC